MPSYWEVFLNGYSGYANYVWTEISQPGWHNYFYWLCGISLFFFAIEWFKPWRKEQPRFRKDFWLDFFYMYFNFFLFSLIIYNAVSDVVVVFFNDLIRSLTTLDLRSVNPMYNWPQWSILLIGFVVRDFVQWNVHRLLHRSDKLWEFHKVHHSVEQMGFAAHLRFHWMETVVYRAVEYLPLALLGIGLYDFFTIHIFTLAVGHYNHSNITVKPKTSGLILGAFIGLVIVLGAADISIVEGATWLLKSAVFSSCLIAGYFVLGPKMKFIFNSPEMHIWHHAYHLPKKRQYGINFGLTLAIWDYIFGTAHIPKDGRDIRLGFPGIDKFPHSFAGQITYGFRQNPGYERVED